MKLNPVDLQNLLTALKHSPVHALGQNFLLDLDVVDHVAAHNTLPRGTKVRVTNTANGKSTVVTVVGGGLHGALIDLSYDAFSDIGDPSAGRVAVRIEKVYE